MILIVSLMSISQPVQANLFKNTTPGSEVLSVDNAFVFDVSQKEQDLVLSWRIAPKHYLYQDKIQIQANEAVIDTVSLPQALSHHDEFFGDVLIYREELIIPITILETGRNPNLTITLQGCADRGICYPPKTFNLPLKTLQLGTQQSRPIEQLSTPSVNQAMSATEVPTIQDTVGETLPLSNQLAFSVWWAFFLGIGVAFTPCVLPMYPLMVGLIAGRKNQLSTPKMGLLVLSYIQGMAVSYTLLGILIALAGLKFQAFLQHPVLLGGIALLFLWLAGSMFGFYQISLSSTMQTKLTEWSNRQKSGTFVGVFFMGAIAGLLCSPCTTAPLSAILLYIAKSGDIQVGGLALYLYALGMGVPLMLFALFGHKLMPKAGVWMQYVKESFGFIILALPLFLLERVVSAAVSELLWSLLVTAFLAWALMIALRSHQAKARVAQIALTLLLLISAYPLQQTVFGMIFEKTGFYFISGSASKPQNMLLFTEISTEAELQEELVASQAKGQKVLIDFYADWCTACKQFEKYTFTDQHVQKQLKDTKLIRLDVTKNRDIDQALLAKYDVLGLPALLLLDEQGQEIHRISGFLPAGEFIEQLKMFY